MNTVTAAVITPTYSGDASLCAELNRSVMELSSLDHYIIADSRDLGFFGVLEGHRTHVVAKEDLLPRGFVRIPRSKRWMCPWTPRPLNGWLVQQIAKFAAAGLVDTDVIVSLDSDVVVVRPMTESDFLRDRKVRMYRRPDGITATMVHHVAWHANACRLLGVAPDAPPMPDYISAVASWSRKVLLAMFEHLETVGGRPWYQMIARTPQFSECLLYGAFVDKVLGDLAPVWVDESNHCLNLEGTSPFGAESVDSLLGGWRDTDFAVMIDSHSDTSMDVRRMIVDRLHRAGSGPDG